MKADERIKLQKWQADLLIGHGEHEPSHTVDGIDRWWRPGSHDPREHEPPNDPSGNPIPELTPSDEDIPLAMGYQQDAQKLLDSWRINNLGTKDSNVLPPVKDVPPHLRPWIFPRADASPKDELKIAKTPSQQNATNMLELIKKLEKEGRYIDAQQLYREQFPKA